MNSEQANLIKSRFLEIMKASDSVIIDDGALLTLGEEAPDDDIFYISWITDDGYESCHIPDSSFEPVNNPHINADGNFELKDNKGHNTIISFFKVEHMPADRIIV